MQVAAWMYTHSLYSCTCIYDMIFFVLEGHRYLNQEMNISEVEFLHKTEVQWWDNLKLTVIWGMY